MGQHEKPAQPGRAGCAEIDELVGDPVRLGHQDVRGHQRTGGHEVGPQHAHGAEQVTEPARGAGAEGVVAVRLGGQGRGGHRDHGRGQREGQHLDKELVPAGSKERGADTDHAEPRERAEYEHTGHGNPPHDEFNERRTHRTVRLQLVLS